MASGASTVAQPCKADVGTIEICVAVQASMAQLAMSLFEFSVNFADAQVQVAIYQWLESCIAMDTARKILTVVSSVAILFVGLSVLQTFSRRASTKRNVADVVCLLALLSALVVRLGLRQHVVNGIPASCGSKVVSADEELLGSSACSAALASAKVVSGIMVVIAFTQLVFYCRRYAALPPPVENGNGSAESKKTK